MQERYKRNLMLKEIGPEGQAKLLSSKVLVIGAGGLGSPAAFYLAAAGVGTLGIVDSDRVELNNLQRQILHTEEAIGSLKVDSAERRLQTLNSEIQIKKYPFRLSAQNASEIIRDYDIVVNAPDNFKTRYEVNAACVALGKPNVYGAVSGYEGQASVFVPGKSPCYECLFPEPALLESQPPASHEGILGALPGVIGAIQAQEAIKQILGIGESLVGRLLVYDALKMKFREVKIERRADCPTCGSK